VQFTSGPAAGVELNKNVWNKLISNEELELDDLKSIEEEESFSGAFGADANVCGWFHKDKEDFRYQYLTKEEVAQADGGSR
jgi:hypothetical protein